MNQNKKSQAPSFYLVLFAYNFILPNLKPNRKCIPTDIRIKNRSA